MTPKDIIALCFSSGIAGAALAKLADYAHARFTVWQYRRRSQRELEKARQLKAEMERAELRKRNQRIARVMAAAKLTRVHDDQNAGIALGPKPIAPEPFRIELANVEEIWPVARYLMITLRGQDRRRFFPGELSRGLDS